MRPWFWGIPPLGPLRVSRRISNDPPPLYVTFGAVAACNLTTRYFMEPLVSENRMYCFSVI